MRAQLVLLTLFLGACTASNQEAERRKEIQCVQPLPAKQEVVWQEKSIWRGIHRIMPSVDPGKRQIYFPNCASAYGLKSLYSPYQSKALPFSGVSETEWQYAACGYVGYCVRVVRGPREKVSAWPLVFTTDEGGAIERLPCDPRRELHSFQRITLSRRGSYDVCVEAAWYEEDVRKRAVGCARVHVL